MKTLIIVALITLAYSPFALGQVSRPVVYKSGNVYHGTYDGFTRPHGYGTMDFPNGDKYEGEWHKGKYHGKGVYTYASGGRCEGTWENGKMVGPGIIYFPNGDMIEAEFTDGANQTGRGKFTYASVYEGDLVNGLPEGEGKKVWPNGASYTGQWHNGAMEGKGTYIFENGAQYTGSWFHGRYNGEGTYTNSRGEVTHAIYKNGKVEQLIED